MKSNKEDSYHSTKLDTCRGLIERVDHNDNHKPSVDIKQRDGNSREERAHDTCSKQCSKTQGKETDDTKIHRGKDLCKRGSNKKLIKSDGDDSLTEDNEHISPISQTIDEEERKRLLWLTNRNIKMKESMMRDFESPASYPLVRIKRKYLRRRYSNPVADEITKAREQGRSNSEGTININSAAIVQLQSKMSVADKLAQKYQERAKTFVKETKGQVSPERSPVIMRYHPRIPKKLKPIFHHPLDLLPQLGTHGNIKHVEHEENSECRKTFTIEKPSTDKSNETIHGNLEPISPRLRPLRPEPPKPANKENGEDEIGIALKKELARKRLKFLKPLFAGLPPSTDIYLTH